MLKRLFSTLFGGVQPVETLPIADKTLHRDRQGPVAPYLLRDDLRAGATSILVLADGPGATQTISFDLPLRRLRAEGRISLAIASEAAFEGLTPRGAQDRMAALFEERRPARVVASRFAGMGAHALPGLCHLYGAELTTHLDDDLIAVPPELGKQKYEKYADPARKNRLRLLCERASRVYVSTQPLASRLRQLGVKSSIVAGDIYCPAFAAPAPFRPPGGSVVFGYMGSSGHAADLDMIAPAIEDVLAQRPDVRFETFGTIKAPRALAHKFPDRVIERKAAGSYTEFLALMPALGWSCGLAPLAPSPFNDCKADTKFVEYSMAGVPAVLSDAAPYRRAAAEGRGILAASRSAWSSAVQGILADPVAAEAQVRRAQHWLQNAYALDRLEAQLLAVLALSPAGVVASNAGAN